MPPFLTREKKWAKNLPVGFVIYKRLETFLGKVISFSVVLIKDRQGVTRFDTAHNCVHRDLLGRQTAGVIDKVWYRDLTLKEGFNFADEDLSDNYVQYFEYYESH